MPHLSELHGASTHLAVVAIPVYALLLVLRRWEDARPWVLGAAVLGTAASGVTGLLVRGQSLTELRGSDYGIGGIHFWLGIGLAAILLAAVALHRFGRRAPVAIVVAAVAVLAVAVQGYLGGRMTYEHGVGVQALGQARQSATGARALQLSLAKGTAPVMAGKAAFARSGLGCASCHGDQAQGARGPRLAGGRGLDDFRRVHAKGLFPPAVVTDADYAAIDAYLHTLRR